MATVIKKETSSQTRTGVVIRAAYAAYDEASYATPVEGESMTKQSFKQECDINNIVKKYQKDGAVTHAVKYGGTYGFASGQTFQDAMNLCVSAQQMFEDLPSDIRNKFSNDPGQFLDYVQDPANAEEMEELGLVVEDPAPAPVLVTVTNVGETAAKAATAAVVEESAEGA